MLQKKAWRSWSVNPQLESSHKISGSLGVDRFAQGVPSGLKWAKRAALAAAPVPIHKTILLLLTQHLAIQLHCQALDEVSQAILAQMTRWIAKYDE